MMAIKTSDDVVADGSMVDTVEVLGDNGTTVIVTVSGIWCR